MQRVQAAGIAILLCLPASARADGIAIDHDAVGCVQAGKFPRFFARFDPSDDVSRARLHFRPVGWPHWYSVPMQRQGVSFSGTLPKPEKSLTKMEYYISAADRTFGETRTPEYAPDVVSGPGGCQRDRLLATSLGKAKSVLVNGPEGIAKLPKVPTGFSGDGVIGGATGTGSAAAEGGGASGSSGATPGTAGAAAAAAGGGGGLGMAALIVGGGAAVAGVAVAASKAGGDGSASTTQPPTTTQPPATVPPTTAPGASLTGTWTGSGSDGFTLNRTETGRPDCQIFADVVMPLTQSGSSISGTATSTTRSSIPAGCDSPGDQNAGPITGTVSGGSVTLVWMIQDVTMNLTGSLSANRMTGTLTGAASAGDERFTGTWAVNRQ